MMKMRIRSVAAALFAPAAIALLWACGDSTSPTPNPTPAIERLEPEGVVEDAGAFALTVVGAGFVQGAVVRWGGSARPTTFVAPDTVVAAIAAADIAEPGVVSVSVFNPAPGGGESAGVDFTISPSANPDPTLTSMEPDTVEAGGDAATLMLTGTGFVQASQVRLGDALHESIYDSPTRLRVELAAEDLAAARIVEVQVENPEPGGGTSGTLSLTVVAPVPSIATLSPAEAEAGVDSLVLTVEGAGFIGNSVVRLDGAAVATRFVSASELEATLPGEALSAAGEYEITVVNPSPGGGTSNADTLSLVHAVPVLERLPSYGAVAGGPGFALMVHGRGFVESSVVRWNGADRPTTYIGPHRLLVTVQAGDVASAGDAAVTVYTPAPGGGTSAAATMTIRALGAATITDSLSVALPANDLAYDPGTGRLYASIPDGVAGLGGTVAAIDPGTGAITDTVIVGSDPGRLALSDGGSTLWVALDGTGELRRVEAATLTAGPIYSLDGLYVEDMRVAPGHAETVAIALRNDCCSPRHEGVSVYDDGVARPVRTPGHTGSNTIVFAENDSVLYGYNNETTEFGFRTMAVGPDGVEIVDVTESAIQGFSQWIEYASGRVYATAGDIVDAERGVNVGAFAVPLGDGAAVLPDPELGRAFFLDFDGAIEVYDLNTRQHLGSVPIPGFVGGRGPFRLVRWSEDGLALRDGARIIILRTPIAGP